MAPALLLPLALVAMTGNPATDAPSAQPPAFLATVQATAVDRWYDGEYKSCDGNTIQLVDCIIGLRDKWDRRLNAAYKKVMQTLPPERRSTLRDAQRKWIAYRDADCGFYAGGEGTISRVEAATCLFALTRDRAQELEMMLQP